MTNRLQESQTMNHCDYQIKDMTGIIRSLMVIRKVNCEINYLLSSSKKLLVYIHDCKLESVIKFSQNPELLSE